MSAQIDQTTSLAGANSCSTEKIRILSNLFMAQLQRLVGPAKVGLLADFPNYANVGDSAIFLGEVAALKEMNAYSRSIDIADGQDVLGDRFLNPPAGSVILINGGGNFGDLWPHHNQVRLRLLQRFPSHRVIQLPQSIHFDSAQALKETAQAVAAHPDFHLMLRDEVSYRFAQEHFKCKCYLVPDAAFSLGALARSEVARDIELLGLLRTDKEMVCGSTGALGEPSSVEDWLVEPASPLHSIDRGLRTLQKNYPSLGLHRLWLVRQLRRWLYEQLAKQRLARGVRQLSRAQAVVTDRLHAWLLCYLLGIPVQAGDNSYRKISNLRETWGLA